MAEQLLLVRTYDFEADQDSVNLLTRTVDGFEPAYGGWTPNVTVDRTGNVKQAITLRVQGTSTDAIATSLQKLADKTEQAGRFYTDSVENYAVWFRVQMSGESKGRQTLVKELRPEPASSVYDVALRNSYHWNKYTLGIDHAPWWEGTAAGTVTGSSVSIFGGTFSYGTVNGDLPARLARVKMQPLIGSGAQSTAAIWPYGQFWLGFRSTRYSSTPSAWPTWYTPLKVGAPTADIYAVGGTALLWSIETGDPGSDDYLLGYSKIDTITNGTPAHMYGSFLVLARAKVTYSSTADWTEGTSELRFRMRMITGFLNDANPTTKVYENARYYPRVTVSKTRGIGGTADYENNDIYRFYELGEVNFPPAGRDKSQSNLGDYSIFVVGEPADLTGFAGTAGLWLNGLVFIPTEGLYWGGREVENTSLASSGNQSGTIAYWGYNGPDDRLNVVIAGTAGAAYAYGSNQPYYRGGVPVGSGIAVLAADAYFGQGTAWKADVQICTVERWQSLRGND